MTYDSGVNSGHKPLRTAGIVGVLVVVVLAIGLLSLTSRHANAAPGSVAGSVLTACNGEQNVGGTGVRCTVTVTNYVTDAGALAASPASTWTVTRCTGAAGEISPVLLPAATCDTTTTAISGQPITSVQMCNGSGSGGGGGVWCTVTVTNRFTTAPSGVFTSATVYQCVSVPLTPGLVCDPTAANNTAASVPTATVGQCNGSGNGGGLVPAVPLGSPNCAVSTASTTTVTLPVHVDQCNGSANGGGSFIKCAAAVTNEVAPATNTPTSIPPTATSTGVPPTATSTGTPTATPTGTFTPSPTGTPTAMPTGTFTPSPTGTPTATPTGTLTPTPTGTPTGTPTATPTGTLTPTPTGTPAGTLTATPTGTLTPTPTGTPAGTLTATPTGTLTPTPTIVGSTVTSTAATATNRPTGVPIAPNTGSGGSDGRAPTWPFTVAGAVLLLAGAVITFAARRKV